ncbi:ATP-dependent Clp protease proteolytic subunit [Paenibacillus sp. TAB 01]|uniref:Clp protease ClpP n=1 Tax=Paenibacillus sp. TAB 01 TaxID=3368988 RepID=UPI0037538C5B
MAGDKIVMAKGAMMMIHNPMTSIYGGEAKDFREAADFLDKIRDSLVSVYADRTGLSSEELIQMLDVETWLSAEEAVDFGFADEIEESTAVTAYMRGAVASVNGVHMDFSRFLNVPKLPEPNNQRQRPAVRTVSPQNASTHGGVTILNLEDLKNQFPDIYTAAVAEGVTAERTRMQALDELHAPGNTELIANAKATGASVSDTAVAIIKAEKQKRAAAGNNMQQDANNSGINMVVTIAAEDGKATLEEKLNNTAKSIADAFNNIRGSV